MKKKHIFLAFLAGLFAFAASAQIRVNIGDKQKITEFLVRNDSLVLSLENSGTNRVYLPPWGTNNDAFSGTALTDGYTFQASDFTTGRKLFYYNGTSDIEVNLPDVAAIGQKLQIWQYNSGNVHVKLAEGVDGISVSTVDNSNPVTITKQFLTLGYRAVGTYALYDTTPTAIYSVANAANPNAEANSFTGFTVDSGPLSLSTDADAQEGSHAVRIDHNGPDNTLGLAVLALGTSLTPNTTYEFNIYLKRAAGSTGNWTIKLDAFRGWSANVASSLITTSEGNGYLLYTLTGTRNGDANSNVTFAFNSNADDADIMLIDNIVIDEL